MKAIIKIMIVLSLFIQGYTVPNISTQQNTANEIGMDLYTYDLELGGAKFQLLLPFQVNEFVSASPNERLQIATSYNSKDYFEVAIIVIPVSPSVLSVQEFGDGILNGQSYISALQGLREQQGSISLQSHQIRLFNQFVDGISNQVLLNISSPEKQSVIIDEWVIQYNDRIWLLRISQLENNYSSVSSLYDYINILDMGVLEQNSENIIYPDKAPLYVDDVTPNDLPFPSWWNGDCDVNNFPGSYPLGASYNGVKACGPLNSYHEVDFGVGVHQYEWQCPELSKRYLYLAFGTPPYSANGNMVVWNYPNDNLEKVTNGTSGKGPNAGDVLSYGASDPNGGHTSIVSASSIDSNGNGSITVVEQNASAGGTRTHTVSNWTVQASMAVSGWLHIPSGSGSCQAPSLIEPANDAVLSSNTITFRWNAISGCTFNGYTFRVCTSSNMDDLGNCFIDTGEGGTQRTETINGHDNQDLFWGVKAANAPNGASWAVRHFRIQPGASCSPSSNQVSLYVDGNYGGQCITKDIGEYPNPGSIGLPNDAISSIRVGSNVKATLCQDDGFNGTCEVFTGDDGNLGDNSIGDNQVSSAKVESNGSSSEVRLYDNPNYGGSYVYTTSPGLYTLVSNFNDMGESISMPSGWSVRLFEHDNYTGPEVCIQGNDSNLSDNYYSSSGNSAANSATWMEVYSQSSCPPITSLPSAPTLSSPANNAVFERTSNITLTWNSANGATEYYAEFWGGPNLNLNSGWTTNLSWYLGSQWGGIYQWRVKSRNTAGESGWSETRTLTIKYGSPTNLSGTAASTSQINLSWSASADAPGNIDGYRIFRNSVAIATVASSVTVYSDTGLNTGTTYSYYVKAYKGTLESNPSNAISVSTGNTSHEIYLPVITNYKPTITSIQVRISATNCDGFEDASGFKYSDPRNWIGSSKEVITGLIFTGVNIPPGSVIKSAKLVLYGYGLDGNATARIYGFAQDNPDAFWANGSNRPSLRPSTTAYTNWYRFWPFAWTTFESPDLSPIVQEIVNRPGWQNGNNMGFKITNPNGTGSNWSIEDYSQGASHYVVLFITYEH